MHSPGICGVILAAPGETEGQAAEGGSRLPDRMQALAALIAELNAGSDQVLVVLRAEDQSLAPVVWAQGASAVSLAPSTEEAAALRVALQEVLNHGRDSALVVWLEGAGDGAAPLTAATFQSMVAAYCAAGDEIWAVVPEAELRHAQPMLLGRNMIEALLRSPKWRWADEVLASNLPHVRRLAAAESIA